MAFRVKDSYKLGMHVQDLDNDVSDLSSDDDDAALDGEEGGAAHTLGSWTEEGKPCSKLVLRMAYSLVPSVTVSSGNLLQSQAKPVTADGIQE